MHERIRINIVSVHGDMEFFVTAHSENKTAPLGRKYFLQTVNGYKYSKFDKGTSQSFFVSSVKICVICGQKEKK
jgi:hypothetical protein